MANGKIIQMQVEEVGAIPSLPDDLKKIKHDLTLLRNFIAENLEEGVDYGWLPFQDKKKDKASLFKPGAEKLTFYHRCVPRFETVKEIEDWDRPFFYYRFRCKLVHLPTGQVVGEGEGSCNSMAEKYRYRWVFENELPPDVVKEELKTKRVKGKDGKWYTLYRIEYEDVASLANTILKMALKSAHIDAALRAFRASWYFTQDIEDMGYHTMDVEFEEETVEAEQKPATTKQLAYLRKILDDLKGLGVDPEKQKEKIKNMHNVEHLKNLPKDTISKVIDELLALKNDLELGRASEEVENEIEEVPAEEEEEEVEEGEKEVVRFTVGEDRPATKAQLAALQELKKRKGEGRFKDALAELGIANEAELTFQTAAELIMRLQ